MKKKCVIDSNIGDASLARADAFQVIEIKDYQNISDNSPCGWV